MILLKHWILEQLGRPNRSNYFMMAENNLDS